MIGRRDAANEGTPPRRSARATAGLGFRRVSLVAVVVDDDGEHAYVTGVAHRLPRTVPAPLKVARELIRVGVPHRTIDRRRPI